MKPNVLRSALVVLLLAAAGAAAGAFETSIAGLRLIGVRTLPHLQPFAGTIVGGLSGLSYEPAADRWLAISDDRSEHSPARAYRLRLDYDSTRFSSATVEAVIVLRQPNGSAYPAKGTPGMVPDFEALAIDPLDSSLWYTSEGDRALGLDPFVRHAARDGRFIAEPSLPPLFRFHAGQEIGPRNNLTFEGLGFAQDGQNLWLAMEAPLYQDGPTPTLNSGALARITRFTRDGAVVAQYAYPIESVPVAASSGRLADNGVAEILALTGTRLLVLERAGRQDEVEAWHYAVRLFEADFAQSTDVAAMPALAGKQIQPAAKQLLLDFAKSGLPPVDNLEGLAWGRSLANGHRTLVLVSDDNFKATQSTQLWVFEVLPANPISP